MLQRQPRTGWVPSLPRVSTRRLGSRISCHEGCPWQSGQDLGPRINGGSMQARLLKGAPESVQADALMVLLLEGERTLPAEVAGLDQKLGGAIQEVVRDRQFTGKHMDQVYLRNLDKLPSTWTLLVGLGKAEALDPVRVRNAVQA